MINMTDQSIIMNPDQSVMLNHTNIWDTSYMLEDNQNMHEE